MPLSRADAEFVAGVAAGTVTSLCLHPIDLLKTRLQIQDGVTHHEYTGLRNAIAQTWRMEGLAGFYKGVLPSCVGNALSWGLYMYFYEGAKKRRAEGLGDGVPARLSPSSHMLAAWEAGTITSLLTNPIWLVKTRLQLQRDAGAVGAYHGSIHAVRSILREEGVRGLYRGLTPALLLVSHGMVQFAVYEELKVALQARESTLHLGANFVAGGVSKLAATVATYPSQVLRSRLQQRGHSYAGIVDCALKIAR